MNADGTGQTRLTTNNALDSEPAWSPDGTKIVFSSTRTGNGDIYCMNADGTGRLRLTTSSGIDLSPAWSPDGTQIAFSSTRDGNVEIYRMNADGTGQTRLTTNNAARRRARLVARRHQARVQQHADGQRRHLPHERRRHRASCGSPPARASTCRRRGGEAKPTYMVSLPPSLTPRRPAGSRAAGRQGAGSGQTASLPASLPALVALSPALGWLAATQRGIARAATAATPTTTAPSQTAGTIPST